MLGKKEDQMEGQMNIFDYVDTWCGKTSAEHLVQTVERTSEPSLKKRQKSKIRMPQFLDLRESGETPDVSWETDGALLGELTMHSIGEYRSAENGFVWSPILTETQPEKSYLMFNFGEKPSTQNISKLSQVLETNPNPKYNLSAQACMGIMNRAMKRGKELPDALRIALERQATPLKLGGGSEVDRYGKKAGKGALVQTELSATLGVSQDQTLITKLCYENHSQDSRYKDLGETCETVSAKYGTGGNNQPLVVEPILLESNQNHATVQTNGISTALPASMGEGGGYVPMVVETSKSDGDRMCYRKLAHPQNSEQAQRWGETEVNDTLNIFDNGEKRTPTLIIEPVCVGNGQVAQTKMMETVGTLNCMHDQQAVMCIGNGQIHDAMSPSEEVSKILNCMDDPMKVMTCELETKTNKSVHSNMIVRRLTCLECERLQGYPDGWTDIGEWVDSKGKKHKDADSPRYKALGNSIALPFWQWMAKRMVKCLRDDGVTEPTMGSLFDGISGFCLVYARAGCKPIFSSEIEEYPIAVAKKHFGDDENGTEGDYAKYL